MKSLFIALSSFFILIFFLSVLGQIRGRVSDDLVKKSIKVDGLDRTFYVYNPRNIPANTQVPLVLVFHGNGGTAARMDRLTGFSELAEKEKFIAVYPQGIQNHWNDGRIVDVVSENGKPVDDLTFAKAMIEALVKDYNIDETRIFSTGISNGGFFSNYLAVNLSEKIAGIAPVAGGISEPLARNFYPKNPVSVFIIQGTDDQLVPYEGGNVAGNRGKLISTDEAVKKWTVHNKTDKTSKNGSLPDTDKKDGCTVETFLWSNGKNSSTVKLFKLNGGGHTWPGGSQYLPKRIVGNVCRDFDAAEAIWEFFKAVRVEK